MTTQPSRQPSAAALRRLAVRPLAATPPAAPLLGELAAAVEALNAAAAALCQQKAELATAYEALEAERVQAEQARQLTAMLIQAQNEQLQAQNQELQAQDRQLRQTEAALRQLNEELEQRVQARTAEWSATSAKLRAANLSLQAEMAERRQAQADLYAANVDLARAARAKDEFLSTMSHELRSPLNTILSTAEVLDDGLYGPLAARQHKALSNIVESGQHLLSLITDILDLSKIEAGRFKLEIRPVAVEDVCQTSLRLIHEQALKKHLMVAIDLTAEPLMVLAEGRRLKQMLVNLLTNAVKFTPPGGAIGLEVTAGPAAGDGEAASDTEQPVIHFTVWDTGVGIRPEDMSQLFQAFVQFDSRLADQEGGTGLGLALVRHMAELQGGSVAVESEPGRGSRFTISLPGCSRLETAEALREHGAEPVRFVPAAAPPGEPGAPRPAIPLLLAEDNLAVIPTLVDYLQARRYRVSVAHNGREALQHACEGRPAAILMDVQMPEVDGLEATRQIRAMPDLAHVPIIALSALVMPGDRERCLAAGANEYLAKPLSMKKLAQVLERLLQPKPESLTVLRANEVPAPRAAA